MCGGQEMLKEAIADIVAANEQVQILALCTKAELDKLKDIRLMVNTEDAYLSMQHMHSAALVANRIHGDGKLPFVLTITEDEEITTEGERALIYAMLVRCRKVISCRDKLEDMLKYDDREGWYTYKAEYEEKVLNLYKATWRDKLIYPYNIVDNIKRYNKDESYILKDLYIHLSERIPGKINPGDAEMINKLRKMFSDISIATLEPQAIIVGNIEGIPELKATADHYSKNPDIKIIKL